MTTELLLSIIGNLSLSILYLTKGKKSSEKKPSQPCPLHPGMETWLREIRDDGKATAQAVSLMQISLARMEERGQK